MTIHVIKITVYAVNTASFKCGLKFKEPYLCFVVFRQYKHQVRNNETSKTLLVLLMNKMLM